jgi:hypothetical protein
MGLAQLAADLELPADADRQGANRCHQNAPIVEPQPGRLESGDGHARNVAIAHVADHETGKAVRSQTRAGKLDDDAIGSEEFLMLHDR